MATLTSTVFFSKRVLYLACAFVIFLITLFILTRLIGLARNRFLPPAQTPSTVAFGKIPKLDLSEGIKPPFEMHYSVETISGDLGTFDESVKVFKIAEPASMFGNLKDTVERARSAGFGEEPKELSESIAKFEDLSDKTRLLTIDTKRLSVSLESDYLNKGEIITARLKSAEDAQRVAFTFFESLKLPIGDKDFEKIFFENYKVENGTLVRSSSLATTNLVKVIFKRKDIDSLPVINPNFDDPLVFALATDKRVVEAEYRASNVQKYKFSTYPLKDVNTAFEDLKSGQGALNKMPAGNAFSVRNVKLGYLETKMYQPYLQPVYIFESDDGLVAYVSAISDSWSH